MGYDLMRFTGVIDAEFHCTICTMVLEMPLQSPCDHLFCSSCIKDWLAIDESCPVDRRSLTTGNLRPPARYFLNMLDKLFINCVFQPEGCTTVLQLEHLNSHQGSCEFSTNLEMVCDKGCNLTVKQCKYQHNCLVHLADRLRAQDEKIYDLTQIVTKFNEETIQLHAQLSKLSRGVTSQQKRITKLNGELNRLRPQNEELHELCNDSTVPAPAAPPQWQKCFNMNVSIDQPNILEFGHSPGSAFAQSLQSLNEANLCFQTQILSDCGPNSIGIGIGLTQKGHPADVPPGHSEGSIGYRCCGQLYYDKCESVASHACKVNDIIECGIKFLRINSCNSGYRSVVVYFSKNGLAFLKKVIRMPLDGLFPTIFMFDIHLGRTMKIKIL